VETRIRQAIRDAVNRNSRKPFHWGGISGYQQLEAIAQALHQVSEVSEETRYLQRLTYQVDRALEKNRKQAQDLKETHQWLCRIADCLHYPPDKKMLPFGLNSAQVARDMETLIQQFRPDARRQRPQAKLANALQKRWRLYHPELLHCYDIPGLPPDNLQMESLFEQLRRRQRRISGRKSTRELRDFGQVQVLFRAESEAVLLEQILQVPLSDYHAYRKQLQQAETPRQFFHRLHHNPLSTLTSLIDQHAVRRTELLHDENLDVPSASEGLHTE
jgi:hypothetical protein